MSGSQSPAQTNLTGKRRILRDKIVDIYNDVTFILDKIGKLASLIASYDNISNNGFKQLLIEISPIADSLNQRTKILEQNCDKITNLVQLCTENEPPPFCSWTYSKFEIAANGLKEYSSEIKQRVTQLIKYYQQNDPRIQEFRLNTWLYLYQTKHETEVKAMLIEADLA